MASHPASAGSLANGVPKSGRKPVRLEQDIKVGTLAEMWEDDRHIRSRIRDTNGKLVVWAKPELINKPTMASIALNQRCLTLLAKWWCPQMSAPKSPSVLDVKKEANLVSKKCYKAVRKTME